MKHYRFARTIDEGERGVPPSSLIPIGEWKKRAASVVDRLSEFSLNEATMKIDAFSSVALSAMSVSSDPRRRTITIGFETRTQMFDLALEEAENYDRALRSGCLQVPNYRNTSSKYKLSEDGTSALWNKAMLDAAKRALAESRSIIERKEQTLVYANLMLPEDAVVAKFGDQEPETTASKDADALRRETADFVREVRKILQNSAYPRDSILAMIAKAIEEGSEKALLANVKRLAGM